MRLPGLKSPIRYTMQTAHTIRILDIPILTLSKKEFLPYWVESEQFQHIVTINAEMFVEASHNVQFHHILTQEAHNIPDSISVIWASHYMNKHFHTKFQALLYGIYSLFFIVFNQKKIHDILPERLSGADIFWDIIGLCNITNAKIFLLGAGEGVAKQVQEIIQEKVPNIKIVGALSGGDPYKNADTIVRQINESGAEMLFVAFGAPKQELWIHQNKHKMPNLRSAIGIGGTFDFIASASDIHGHGTAKRAPQKWRDLGLEWLWRLFTQPFRWKRIKHAVFDFPRLVITYKVKHTI